MSLLSDIEALLPGENLATNVAANEARLLVLSSECAVADLVAAALLARVRIARELLAAVEEQHEQPQRRRAASFRESDRLRRENLQMQQAAERIADRFGTLEHDVAVLRAAPNMSDNLLFVPGTLRLTSDGVTWSTPRFCLDGPYGIDVGAEFGDFVISVDFTSFRYGHTVAVKALPGRCCDAVWREEHVREDEDDDEDECDEGYVEYPHPHIGTDGKLCLGTAASDLLKHMDGKSLLGIISTVSTHLRTYSPVAPYTTVESFLEGATDPWSSLICPVCELSMKDGSCSCEGGVLAVDVDENRYFAVEPPVPQCAWCCKPVLNLTSCACCENCCAKHHTLSPEARHTRTGIHGSGCVPRVTRSINWQSTQVLPR